MKGEAWNQPPNMAMWKWANWCQSHNPLDDYFTIRFHPAQMALLETDCIRAAKEIELLRAKVEELQQVVLEQLMPT